MPPSATAPAHDGELLERVVFEIKRVIVGQDRLVERMLVGLLARGHLLLEGVPGVAKTLAVETVATGRRRHVRPPAVHPGPGARRHPRHPHLPAGPRGVRRRARPGRRQLRARRRDQPRPGEGAVGDAGGDGRAARVDRRAHLPDARPVPRARHPEPDRERGRLPAARGAARPLPLQDHRGLPGAGGGARDRLPDGRRAAGRAAGHRARGAGPAAGRRVARVRPPRAGRLRGAAGGRHPHARPSTGWATSPAGWPTARPRAPRSGS